MTREKMKHAIPPRKKTLLKKDPGTQEWDEVNVLKFQAIAFEFYDFIIANVKEYKAYFIDKTLTIAKARQNNAYILFRPVGLFILARLYTYFKKKGDLVKLKKTINKIGFIAPNSPYNQVLWNGGAMEAKEGSQVIAFNLTLYLLNEYPVGNTDALLKKYREITKKPRAKLPKPIVVS